MKTIFTRGGAPEFRLLCVFIAAIILMIVDQRTAKLEPVRSVFSVIVSPAHFMSNWPSQIASWMTATTSDRDLLIQENKVLKQKNLLLQRRSQKIAALAAENIRLRALLNSSTLVEESVIVAEVIGVDPDPYTHEIILNRGSKQGVAKGQAVLDSQGLMGQVVIVEPWVSRVMLITDSSHALPVQVNRNGIRAIAAGSGFLDTLMLKHIPDTADIRKGDLLVSSGLGGRFPFGYPVAEVIDVKHDPGKPFAEVIAKPKSKLDRVRHVLLVHKEDHIEFEQEDEAVRAAEDAQLESITREMQDPLIDGDASIDASDVSIEEERRLEEGGSSQ